VTSTSVYLLSWSELDRNGCVNPTSEVARAVWSSSAWNHTDVVHGGQSDSIRLFLALSRVDYFAGAETGKERQPQAADQQRF